MEETLKLEKDTQDLKRAYKYALENLERVKSDTQDVISTKERLTKEIELRSEDLLRITNDISNEKLKWINERNDELEKIKDKNVEVDKILARSSELDEKERKVNTTKNEIIAIRNENRQLELTIANKNVALDVKNKEIDDKFAKFEEEKANFQLKKQDFKDKVAEILNNINKL